jgi:uncharacterized protein (TIGR00369 family)
MKDFADLGRAILKSQPFSELLGTELMLLEPGKVELRLPITPALKQQHGFVHGGVLAYLADNAITFACGTRLKVPVVTAEMKINYLRPAQGTLLIARAEALSAGRSQSVGRCDVFVLEATGEKLCAAAQGTIMALPSAAQGPIETGEFT